MCTITDEFLVDNIERFQLQLQMQLQQEQMKYREAIKEDKVLQTVKPIRLRINFLQEKLRQLE